MIGIKELADRLNISIGTVSRALNNKPDVNPETRSKVLEAAKKFGYVANQSGRSLRQGSTNTVGLMLTVNAAVSENKDSFFLGLTEGIQRVLQPHNLDLVILPRQESADSVDFLRRVLARRFVDAMIITGTEETDARLQLLKEAKMPFVSLGRSKRPEDFAWTDLNFEWVVKTSIDRLVALGHQKIGVVLPDSDEYFGKIYFEAYKQALADHGIALNSSYVSRAESSERGGYDAAGDMLACEERPTAVLLIYEMMADGFYRRLNENNLKPGTDMALIGFRDRPEHWNLVPKLTAFKIDILNLGVSLGKQLLSQMPAFAEDYADYSADKIWPLELVPGGSDGPPL